MSIALAILGAISEGLKALASYLKLKEREGQPSEREAPDAEAQSATGNLGKLVCDSEADGSGG